MRDGEYSIRLLDSEGRLLGQAVATLDTNRRPLLEAAGTLFEIKDNLTCLLPSVNEGTNPRNSPPLALTVDEQWGYFYINSNTDNFYTPGVYRMHPDGSGLQRVVDIEELWDEDLGEAGPHAISNLVVSESGDWIALTTEWFNTKRLWIAQGDGSSLHRVSESVYQVGGFDSGDRVVYLDLVSIAVYAVGTEPLASPEVLYQPVGGRPLESGAGSQPGRPVFDHRVLE